MSADNLVSLVPQGEAAIRAALDSGADPNAPDDEGNTPLAVAAEYVDPSSMALLLDRGADPNGRTENGRTALMHLAWAPRSRDWGRFVDEDLSTVVTRSWFQRDEIDSLTRARQAVRLLLDRRADPHATDAYGVTALMYAAENIAVALVRLLLEHGVDPNFRDATGNTALILAAQVISGFWGDDDNVEALNVLIDGGAEIDAANQAGFTALIASLYVGSAAHVRLLVERGASVEPPKGPLRRLAITFAVVSGQMSRLQAALKRHPAKVNRSTPNRRTPLMWASILGLPDAVTALLDAGAKVNAAEKNGWTALLHAVFYGHTQIVRKLLEAGADVTACGEENWRSLNKYNALYWAIHQHRDEIIPILLEYGANLVDDPGGPTIGYLASKGYVDLVKRLHAEGEHLYLGHAVSTGDVALVQSVIDAGEDINEPSQMMLFTVLHLAAEKGFADVIRLLLSCGALVDAATWTAETSLMMAAREGHEAAVRALLDGGADPNLRNSDKATAADVARNAGHESLAQILSEAGGKVKRPRRKRVG